MVKNSKLVILAFGLCTFLSCSDDNESFAGKAVVFSSTTQKTGTRTSYASGTGDAEWVINWTAGDKILIHCDECKERHSAVYNIETGGTAQSEIKPNGSQLYWNDDASVNHVFTAAYPAGKATDLDRDRFKFPIPFSQGDLDMSNAYMVARNSGIKSSEAHAGTVLLTFNSIMTTFEVKLRGIKTDDSDASTRYVKSVEFSCNMPVNSDGTTFTYNSATGNAEGTQTHQTITWTPSTPVEMRGSMDKEHESTLTFTVLLPFTVISNSNPLEITINTEDKDETPFTYVSSLRPTNAIEGGEKKKLIMDNFYTVHNSADDHLTLNPTILSADMAMKLFDTNLHQDGDWQKEH